MDIMEKLDSLHRMGADKYVHLWQYLFANMLQGFWPRLFAVCFLGLSFWFGVRRRNLQLGFVFFVLTLFVTFAAQLLKLSGLS